MNLPSKYLLDLLAKSGNLLSDSSSENWQTFMSAFSEVERLEKRMSENTPLLLQRQTTSGNYRDDESVSPELNSEWVFTSTTGSIRVVIELERRVGKFVLTGQIFPGEDDLASWAGAQLEVSREHKVIALGEVNADGEFEITIESKGAIDCTIVALNGSVLEIKTILIP